MNKICLKIVNSGDFAMILLLRVRKLDFCDFVSASRDLSPNFLKLKNCIQKVLYSPSILKKMHDSVWEAYFLQVQQRKPG